MKRASDETTVPHGGFVTIGGGRWYRIAGYDRLDPFLMNIPSDTDLWMYISSNGGLTAGRGDAEQSLFPYETVDRLHDGHHHTGPVTIVRARAAGGDAVAWQPFSDRAAWEFRVERNISKNLTGNRVVFEEINHELGLAFRYRWAACDELGFVRTATIENRGGAAVALDVLDGLRNVLPYGAPLALYQQSSSLVDAYRRSECDAETGLGIFSLTSRIIDRAEAAEELRANAAWFNGPAPAGIHLSAGAVAAFRRGESPPPESVLNGRRGNYLASFSLDLPPGNGGTWHICADVGLDHIRLVELRDRLRAGGYSGEEIEALLDAADENLLCIIGGADGLQCGGHEEATAHHAANVLFNCMRGGVFAGNGAVPAGDLAAFVRERNAPVAERHGAMLAALPEETDVDRLIAAAEETGDADLVRLCHEYLPLWFGRRHGDPSRPWNRFSIRVKNPDGTRALRYEGNWRDIFQNWEALLWSFPAFLPGVVAKFVNASTVDGFNPYRISREGIDWEVVDPDDPWSYIGYWGDHQIVYLLRFLEMLPGRFPGLLGKMLTRAIFSYADVPYRLKPYREIVRDPKSTIVFDAERDAGIARRVETIGADGKLLHDTDGTIRHVTLAEKLLVPALSKLSNLVPGGGIWMNTQRPEWNDANNALVGGGLSVVTLCYLRRYLRFLADLAGRAGAEAVPVSAEVVDWFRRVRDILLGAGGNEAGDVDDAARRRIMDELGEVFSAYRETVYAGGFSKRVPLAFGDIVAFCREAGEVLDATIGANRRDDGLYHSYNLLDLSPDGRSAAVRRLYPMLEGQVAVLGSGAVGPAGATTLVDALFASGMYRENQRSFMLYPERQLPSFLDRNVVPEDGAAAVPLLRELLAAGDETILSRDVEGRCRFNGDIGTAGDVAAALDRLAADPRWAARVAADRRAVIDLFGRVFDHAAFTGRSGTMYGYEGLGCIYWHMVSKLLLAVQETALAANRDGRPGGEVDAVVDAYYRIRSGLSFEKSVAEYGAFPMDPYSHTPPAGGAKQPGMTGQVKEEIVARWGELGVTVQEGVVSFRPWFLRRAEFLEEPSAWRHRAPDGHLRSIDVPAGSLAFICCGVPVIYAATKKAARIRVTREGGQVIERDGDQLDLAESEALLRRRGGIERIDVLVLEDLLG
ncbi:MAG: hypothetical protein JW876_02290 [Candidatus Krumholzibacteriota bacterium]|nr:hypothetical protein [Candidatus Krumholzibacteriota bacterium]